ncbi:DNA double-strand break repair nuclease NurA [Thermosynechococcaceae cyanobacterium BACA0444]|uniref:DNA double-strand break repair nuclease NurA n=1 Tax=Pseudocalidococcus azoricus BACA0444 TaxID=2918990 RepID=A0AAE4FU23_9CYAN|nr:DNA double-strand break repair nuclease NurA [Pseudocalidococcus azoricus]MDS3861878.1 DNA double-strand break repair nuclease NurA [Pseudocalidococcus azoricus BACA0444]
MLNLNQVAQQITALGQHFYQEAQGRAAKLHLAGHYLAQAQGQDTEFSECLAAHENQLRFTPAWPATPLTERVTIPPAPVQHRVMATDGSQIAPSHHEIAFCYLINVGRVRLDYGSNIYPLLDSVAEVFYTQAEVYAAQAWGITPEEWMRHKRTQLEILQLVELALEKPVNVPTVLMLDGSLIHWAWETLPTMARQVLLEPILQAWGRLETAKIPIVGYLSACRSSETLNYLRLQACPYPLPRCQDHCPAPTRPPCQIFTGLQDPGLWSTQLSSGQRGPLWQSRARILVDYGQQRIFFCYFHVGSEVVRVEFPRWVAEDQTLLTQALSLTIAQVIKGYGYPVALAEAHNQAVVRSADRARFFALLERELIKAGLKQVAPSPKESRKRQSIA